jgi:hypothetical protein
LRQPEIRIQRIEELQEPVVSFSIARRCRDGEAKK